MTPTFYSFRRCPYAMRARLALLLCGQQTILREVVLRDKPAAFLEASVSGTVPCLVTAETTIDESRDIMVWACTRNDPHELLNMPTIGQAWIDRCDGPFKHALDRTKYETRYPGEDPAQHRNEASAFLNDLDDQIDIWIFGRPTLADYAILPFVRQFAFIDKAWFDAQPWPNLQNWLATFLASDLFVEIMAKYPQWKDGDPPTLFPPQD